ncbi:MAG: type II secretion system protein L, partial [Pseudohongiellaceae bacterium]
MTKQLIIRFIDSAIEAGTVLPWFLFDQQQQLIDDGHHALNEIYSQLSQENQDSLEVHIIVPNDAVLLAQVNIPSQNARQIKQALPYAIEELIAEDIENVHMALPNYLNVTNHMTDVAVVSHRYLISWLDLLHHHGLSPDSMAIDTLCVPIEEGGSVLVDDDERLLVRYSQTYGFSCDTAVFPYLYPQGLTESANEDELPLLEVLHCSCDETAQNFEYPGAIESHYKESGSEILAVTLANPQNKTINLLQGGYKQVDSSISVTQVWFKPLAAAAVCLFLFV